MEITEEQRTRAEANRLAALAKRKAASSTTIGENPWKLFRCRKISPEHNNEPIPPKPEIANPIPKPPIPQSANFRVTLEISSPDSFSITPEALPNSTYPGEIECLQTLNHLLSFVMPSHYTQTTSGGKALVYKLRDYDMVLKCLKKFKSIDLQEIPWRTLNVIQNFLHSFVTERWIPCMPEHLSDDDVDELIKKLPKILLDALLPFQLDGLRFGLRRGGCCLIADEMGLGKTIQAIAIAGCFMNEGHVLVVCPAILRFSWAEELERWLPFCSPTDVHLVFGHQDNPAHLTRCPRVVVISYTMLCRLRKSILEQEWALLIVDESHHIRCTKKSSESEEIKSVLDVAAKVKHKVLLSGTPSLSRPYDIFHQINILWPGLLGRNKYEFAKSYCAVNFVHGAQGKLFQDYSKGTRLEELNVLLKQTVMIRRLKEHVLAQLPPKRRQVIRLMLSRSDITSAIAATRTDDISCREREQEDGPLRNESNDCPSETDTDEHEQIENSNEGNDNNDCDRSSRILSNQELGIAKLSGFREWLSIHPIVTESNGEADSDMGLGSQKTIIFAHHLKVLDGVQEIVCEKGIGFVRIDGSTLARDRQSALRAFQSSSEVKIAIIGITAGGFGLDFSLAKNVVFLELPRSSSDMLQAEDRAHRRGQTNAVNIYIFCAKDTLDESHWRHLNKSLHRVSSVMNGKYDAVREIEVDGVSDLCSEREFPHCESSDGNDTGNLDTGAPGSDLVNKFNNHLGYKLLSEKAECDELSEVEMTVPHSSVINLTMQPVGEFQEISGKSYHKFSKHVEADKYSSTQTYSHTGEGTVYDIEMDEDAISNRGLKDHSLKVLRGCSNNLSAYKMDETIEKDEGLEHITLERILVPEADTMTISQKAFTDFELEANRMHNATSERGESEPADSTEVDKFRSIQPEFLRFEVSRYTGRVHLYTCIPGRDSRPRLLLKNFRPEEVESLNLFADEISKKTNVDFIKENLACKSVILAFIKEWNYLRPIEQRKLLRKPLQLPLVLELCYLKESINHEAGGLLKGGSKRRATPLDDISYPLPENAVWKKISLCSGNRKKATEYTQGWTLTGEPLCKLCQTPCMGKLSKTPEYFEDLFCNLDCYQEYRIRTSQRSLRKELFNTEHGVCRMCNLDCHKLIQSIRPLSATRRKEYIKKVAPNVASRKKLLDKLISEPKEGNAWHADHIKAVYQGGGECNLENMRTLCVACHYEVTAAQRTERRLENKKNKELLRRIQKDLKDSDSTRKTNCNSEDQDGTGIEEDAFEVDELLIKVPGSAYSETNANKKTASS